jgi:hypothetical protein
MNATTTPRLLEGLLRRHTLRDVAPEEYLHHAVLGEEYRGKKPPTFTYNIGSLGIYLVGPTE